MYKIYFIFVNIIVCLFVYDLKFLFRFIKFLSNNNFVSNNCVVELIKNNCF